MPFEYRILY